MSLRRWLGGSFEGSVPRPAATVDREVVVRALDRAGYLLVAGGAGREDGGGTGGYRQAAASELSLSLTFAPAAGRPRARAVRVGPLRAGAAPASPLFRVHVWAHDASTLAFRVEVSPWAIALMVLACVGSAVAGVAAFVGADRPGALVAGALGAVASLAMPRIWLDDVRDRVQQALAAIAPPEVEPENAGEREPLESPVEPTAGSPAAPRGPRVAPRPLPPEAIRIVPTASDSRALATAAKTARDAFVRHADAEPEDTVEALEREGRRGGS